MKDGKIVSETANIVQDLKKTRGCPVCNHIGESVLNFFSSWVYDLAEKEEAQRENARKRGLCPFHTWQLISIGSPLGISKGYSGLIREIAAQLAENPAGGAEAAWIIGNLMNSSRNCRVCLLERKEETRYISRLASFLKTEENRKKYNASDGLCLRHLQSVVMEVKDADLVRFLIRHAADTFTAIAVEMENYCRKRANSQKDLLTKNEKSAYLRGIIHAVGSRQMAGPF
jgi:hypothetical protein